MGGALREVLARFGFEIADADKLDKAQKKADGFANSLKDIAGVMLGAALIDKVKGFVNEIQQAGDALNDTSAQLGVGTDELQRWQYAAKMSGASTEGLNTALRILQKNSVDAAAGGGAAASVFAELGVPVKNAAGDIKSATQLMGDVGIEIAKMKTPAERTAAALKVFGKQGSALVPIFAEGEEGLQKLLDRFDELGGGYSEDAIAGAAELGDAVDDLDFATSSLKSRLAVSLFPVLSQWLMYGTKLVAGLAKATEGTHIFQAGAVVLGAIVGKVLLGMYAKFLPIIIAVALVTLLVDDLITLFKGGDSAIGRLLDKLFDPKTGPSVAKMIAEDFDALSKRVGKTKSFGDAVEEVFSSIGSSIVSFFVDDIPDAIIQMFADLTGTTTKQGDGLFALFKESWTIISDWIVKNENELIDAIIDGIVDGLKNGGPRAVAAFIKLAKDMAGGFTDLFKIHSPSKLGFEWTSEDIPDGLIGGFAARSDDLAKSAQQFYSNALPPDQASYTPVVHLPAAPGPSHAEYTVQQVNHNSFQVSGSGNTGIANAVRDGQALALNDDRNAALAALETLAEES